MCGPTKAPPVVKNDPVADQKKAEAKATSKSNAGLAARRRRLAQNSLLTMGAQGTAGRVKTADNLLASIDQGLAPPPTKGDRMNTGGNGKTDWVKLRDDLKDPTNSWKPWKMTKDVGHWLGF